MAPLWSTILLHSEKMTHTIREFSGFILVGVLNTLLGLSIIFLGLYLGMHDFIANFLGYSAGLINGYFFNKHFVFKTKNKVLLTYSLAFLLSYLANVLILFFSLHFKVNPYIAQMNAMIVYTLINYLLNKLIVFKK